MDPSGREKSLGGSGKHLGRGCFVVEAEISVQTLSGLGVFCFKGKEHSFLAIGGYVILEAKQRPRGKQVLAVVVEDFHRTEPQRQRPTCRTKSGRDRWKFHKPNSEAQL